MFLNFAIVKSARFLSGLDMEAKKRFINKINFILLYTSTKLIYISLYVIRVSTLNTETINPCVMSTWV